MAGLCCTSEELAPAAFTFQGAALLIDLERAPALCKTGGSVKVVDLGHKVNLIVVHAEGNRFVALDRSCTHGGAQVVYNRHNRTVQCTSWGHSEFALDGALLGGSAKRPLKSYPVRRAGDRLEVLLGTAL
jgi:Rieske Fe-S protein